MLEDDAVRSGRARVVENGMIPFMTQASPRSGLALIALFKLVKGVILLLVGAGLLRLVDPEIATFLVPAVDLLHLHGHSRLVHALLLKVGVCSSQTLFLMAYASLLYSVFLLIEGCGLWLEASWAGYMAVISTSVFLPVEFYDVLKQISVMHVTMLLLNVAIAGYLLRQLGEQTFR